MNTILVDDERPNLPDGTHPQSLLGQMLSKYAIEWEAAVLAKLARQEPVAWIANDSGYNYVQWAPNKNWPVGTKFYTHPAPQQADRHALQNQGKHPAPCARFCESKAYEIEIRQLKSQLGQADRQRVPDWRPIETAPKDGTAILVSEGRFARCVEWNDEYEWWAVDDNKLGPFRLRGAAPTHWMPLPAAPDAAPEAPAQEKSNG